MKISLPAEIGGLLEQRTVVYLRGLGWSIVSQNWRKPWGELDIVAIESTTLVVVEVKARRLESGKDRVDDLELLPFRKRMRIYRTLRSYLANEDLRAWAPQELRLDLVVWRGDGFPEFRHYRGVL